MVRLDAIAWHARHHPGRPALHDLGSGRRWSYRQADAAIARAAALLQHLEERLARYKVPKFITFIDTMPRNAAGKLHKASLRRRAQAEARARAQGAKE